MNTIASSNASLSSVPACFSSQQSRLLSELWLLSASCFLKLGKLEEALKAVEEAENADRCTNPRVWCMLGRIHLASQDLEEAMEALDKGLMIDPNSVECRVWLAQAHMALGRMETAEGLLEPLTKGVGWDCAEAWQVHVDIVITGDVCYSKRQAGWIGTILGIFIARRAERIVESIVCCMHWNWKARVLFNRFRFCLVAYNIYTSGVCTKRKKFIEC